MHVVHTSLVPWICNGQVVIRDIICSGIAMHMPYASHVRHPCAIDTQLIHNTCEIVVPEMFHRTISAILLHICSFLRTPYECRIIDSQWNRGITYDTFKCSYIFKLIHIPLKGLMCLKYAQIWCQSITWTTDGKAFLWILSPGFKKSNGSKSSKHPIANTNVRHILYQWMLHFYWWFVSVALRRLWYNLKRKMTIKTSLWETFLRSSKKLLAHTELSRHVPYPFKLHLHRWLPLQRNFDIWGICQWSQWNRWRKTLLVSYIPHSFQIIH